MISPGPFCFRMTSKSFQTRSALVVLAVLVAGWSGCVPAPDHQTTKIESSSDLKLRMTEQGRMEVSRSAAETTPVPAEDEVESSEDE